MTINSSVVLSIVTIIISLISIAATILMERKKQRRQRYRASGLTTSPSSGYGGGET